jgi:hypothetical protein
MENLVVIGNSMLNLYIKTGKRTYKTSLTSCFIGTTTKMHSTVQTSSEFRNVRTNSRQNVVRKFSFTIKKDKLYMC